MSTLTLLLAATLAVGLPAQNGTHAASRAPAAVPFGPGERLEYDVSVGLFGNVGAGFLEVRGLETIRGRQTYHLAFGMSASALLGRLKVDDVFQSWMDVSDLYALRFKQDQDEPFYERNRTFEFFPEQMQWRLWENGRTGELASDRPLDDVSFLYYVRTLPLKVGDVYTLDRYYKADGNPVVVKVVRRDTIKVPAGTFRTIVVQPVIKTDGLFGEGGQAEVHFSDDDRRLLVQIKSNIPALKSLELRLKSVRAGTPLPGARR